MGTVASVGLGWLAARGLHWGQVFDALKGAPLPLVALALLVFLLSGLVRAYRWQLLFVHHRISVARLFVVENIGLGVNNLMPLRIASEVVQFTLLTTRDRVDRGTTLATVGMTRVMDIWASTLLLGGSLLLVSGANSFPSFVGLGITLSLLSLALLRLLVWGGSGHRLFSRLPLLIGLSQSLGELERRKLRLVASLLVSLCQWIALGMCAWIVAWGMGLPLSFAEVMVVTLATLFVATSVPSLPGAVGTYEAAMIYMTGLFQVDRDLAFPYALVMHVLLFLPPTVVASVFLPREGVGSLTQMWGRARDWRQGPQSERT